jgi:endogenous inhibitor of DNA gyrase (YacG/DUF329 family)
MSQPFPEARPCPICGKPRVERFRPFCSRRCADIDLAHWLKGDYAIPSRDSDEGGEETVDEAEADNNDDAPSL